MKTIMETNVYKTNTDSYDMYCIWRDGKYLIGGDLVDFGWTDDPSHKDLYLFRNKDKALFHLVEYNVEYDTELKKDIPGRLAGAKVRKIKFTTTTTVNVTEFADMEYVDVKTDYSKLNKKENVKYCIECDKPATWVRQTQFSGDHPYCLSCAKKEKDFKKSHPSYFYWKKIKNNS